MGVIAQELKEILPHAVVKHPLNDYYTVDNDWLFFTMVQAVKDVDKIVQNIKKELNKLIKDCSTLVARVNNLEIGFNNLAQKNMILKTRLDLIEDVINNKGRK